MIFLLTPLAIRALGPEGWGIWQIVNAATAYATQINLSLGTAIHQQVAVNVARRDYERLARAFTATAGSGGGRGPGTTRWRAFAHGARTPW